MHSGANYFSNFQKQPFGGAALMMALQPVRAFKIFRTPLGIISIHIYIADMRYREPPPDEFNDD